MHPCPLPFNLSADVADELTVKDPDCRGVSFPIAFSVLFHLVIITAVMLIGKSPLSSNAMGEKKIQVTWVTLSNPVKMPAVEAIPMVKEKSRGQLPHTDPKKSDIIPEEKEMTAPLAASPAYDSGLLPANPPGTQMEKTEKEAPAQVSRGWVSERDHAEGETVIRQAYLDDNFRYIQEKIAQNLTYPPVARRMKQQGTVMVSFSILESGMVENIVVESGSGFKLLDDHAMAVIKNIQPFPKPPVRAQITIPIKFSLSR